MMQHILYQVDCEPGREKCHEWRDDCDFNSDSESMEGGGEDMDEKIDEDGDSEEDKGMETDQQASYDGSDFCLPFGY
ncbi:hypothetical protein FDECE_13247 [Fusarium decemcellulare]|nr:hypothetical protein FDECE_13247 [Fusarium decemcellulare]